MTDHPYTDADLRAEAARQLAIFIKSPSLPAIGALMRGASIPSRPDTHWDDLAPTDFDAARNAVSDLIAGAADVSKWAVGIGADGLEPVGKNLNIQNQAGENRVRLHFAFAPDMDKDTREAVMEQVAYGIRHHS